MSGPRRVTIDRLTLRLPPGRGAEARRIAREIGRALGGLPVEGAKEVRRLETVVTGPAPARAIGRRVARAAGSLKSPGGTGDGG